MEYTIYEAEIREAKDKLDTLAVDREEVNKKQNQVCYCFDVFVMSC